MAAEATRHYNWQGRRGGRSFRRQEKALSDLIYCFQPIYHERIWGDRAFERLFGRTLPEGKLIGESWELADLPEGRSRLAEGEFAGLTIDQLLRRQGKEILGASGGAGQGFPLLLKYLDANDTLSLQVHPDEQTARRMGGSARSKTECWYVLESRNGYILKGLAPGAQPEDFRKALAGDDPAALLPLVRRYAARPGDFHYLPAGTVHALGSGVVVAEVQTPSDTTYRVSDWGRGRPVHLQEAMASINFDPAVASPPGAAGTAEDPTSILAASPYFTVMRHRRPAGKLPWRLGRCAAWMVIAGAGDVWAGQGDPVRLHPGRTLLFSAALPEATLRIEQEMTWLEIILPQDANPH
jgi:mannose-6-phosphate isomerase